MEKNYLTAIELLKIAGDHAYCAEHLLKDNGELTTDRDSVDTLVPFISVIYVAFELTFKAYLLHHYGQIRAYKNLSELIETEDQFGLTNEDKQLIITLHRQHAFHKGVDFKLWKNRQEFHVFCVAILDAFVRLHEVMPIELQHDYNNN